MSQKIKSRIARVRNRVRFSSSEKIGQASLESEIAPEGQVLTSRNTSGDRALTGSQKQIRERGLRWARMMKSFLHRHIWQRLPRGLRRAALFNAAAAIAPRPMKNAQPSLPIVVAGWLRTASGLGQSARLCHEALKARGYPVLGCDLGAAMMQPADVTDFDFADARTHEGPGVIILHVSSPLVPLAIARLGRQLLRGKYVVGYWAWELPLAPRDWRHGVTFVHEIWTPSTFTAEAVRPIASGRAVYVVPHPVALNAPPVRQTDRGNRPFTALTLFDATSSFARKNPIATIAAFRKAFGDDASARLVVKASHLSRYPENFRTLQMAIGEVGNIDLIDKVLTAAEIDALYSESDVVMSLHRSEGFGLILAEAMMRTLPVIATDWSGNVDFSSAEAGLPVGYRLVPAEDPQEFYHHPEMTWADADVDMAAQALRRLRSDPELARRLGLAGAAFAAREWSADRYGERVRQLLRL